MRLGHVTGLLLMLLVGLTACRGETDLSVPAGQAADWPAYGATPGGTHYSKANQITPDNVAGLTLAWEHRSGDVRQANMDFGPGELPTMQSSHQVTPIMVDDRLYYCTPFNRVFALDADTGAELWSFDPQLNLDQERIFTNCRGVSYWASGKVDTDGAGICEKRIVMGTQDARLIVLDADTGKPCTDFGDKGQVDTSDGLSAHHPAEYGISSPPAILGNSVITGGLVLDNQRTDSPGGVVRSYDIRSGELLWAWNPVPPGGPDKNPDGTWRSGTTNVWSIIAVDPARNLVFLPTGNTTPDYYGGHRGGDPKNGLDYYSSALVALDGSTGDVVWHFQFVHHDVWDYDTPAQPTLVDIEVDGKTVPAVVQVTKMGMTFAFNRETGEPLWPIEERPVPQSGAVPGEYLSPTQPFPTHIPYTAPHKLTDDMAWGLIGLDARRCRQIFSEYENRGIYTPPSLKGSVHYPANAGGNNWGSPAIDPARKIMIVQTSNVPSHIKLIPRDQCEGIAQPQNGTPYCVETGFIMSPLGIPCSQPPWGTLDAIDIEAGKILWSVPLGTSRDLAPFPFWWIKGLPGFGGPIVTASGLVFSGVANEHAFRAYSLQTGAELWKTRLPTAGNAVPMTYQTQKGGRQYVVIAVGGHWSGGAPPSDHLMAFALPD